jgi:hypothetical protein
MTSINIGLLWLCCYLLWASRWRYIGVKVENCDCHIFLRSSVTPTFLCDFTLSISYTPCLGSFSTFSFREQLLRNYLQCWFRFQATSWIPFYLQGKHFGHPWLANLSMLLRTNTRIFYNGLFTDEVYLFWYSKQRIYYITGSFDFPNIANSV